MDAKYLMENYKLVRNEGIRDKKLKSLYVTALQLPCGKYNVTKDTK